MAHVDELWLEDRTDHELSSCVDHARGGIPVQDGTGAQQESWSQGGRQSADQIDRAGHGHRDLEHAYATLDERIDNGAQPFRLFDADHGNDASLFDGGCDLWTRGHRASHPPSTVS